MAEFTIEDSLKKHDKDKDGQISKKEFLGEKICLERGKQRSYISLVPSHSWCAFECYVTR